MPVEDPARCDLRGLRERLERARALPSGLHEAGETRQGALDGNDNVFVVARYGF